MTASKEHFEMIARVLRDDKERRETVPMTTEQYGYVLASSFADELSSTNERFDRERFLKACGVKR